MFFLLFQFSRSKFLDDGFPFWKAIYWISHNLSFFFSFRGVICIMIKPLMVGFLFGRLSAGRYIFFLSFSAFKE
jgi:hypothetical protein